MEPAIVLFIFVVLLVIYKSRKKSKFNKDSELIASFSRKARVSFPKVKRKDGVLKTTDELQRDIQNYNHLMSERGKSFSKVEKIKQQRLGVTHYIWRSSEDSDCCVECSKNNGKKFSWRRPPKAGHPGEGNCCQDNICRCYPEAIIK